MTAVWCELALVDGRPTPDVRIEFEDGRFSSIEADAEPGDAVRLGGFTIPGLANAHSHAFHRALRSRTQAERGTFWNWRELMYLAADRLDPVSYHRLARAVFAEMALAGITCVGEFHYLHHQADGSAYEDPNAMGNAILAAAADVGVRITLLDTLYLHGGLDTDSYRRPEGTQRRFSDGTVDRWVNRVEQLQPSDTQRIGAAVHSVRAVAPEEMAVVAEWASRNGLPIHAHVSEQRAENTACSDYHGATPMAVIGRSGLLGPNFSVVHGTHLVDDDISALAAGGSTVVMCPTTERDLGDGIGPTNRFADLGVAMALGSDSHAVIDLFEEARALELHERLRSETRGIHQASDLLAMGTGNGHRSLGWMDAGTISVGGRADLVCVSLDSVRTAGTHADAAVEAAVFAAGAADVTDVYIDGCRIVTDGRHRSIDVRRELDAAIKELMAND